MNFTNTLAISIFNPTFGTLLAMILIAALLFIILIIGISFIVAYQIKKSNKIKAKSIVVQATIESYYFNDVKQESTYVLRYEYKGKEGKATISQLGFVETQPKEGSTIPVFYDPTTDQCYLMSPLEREQRGLS